MLGDLWNIGEYEHIDLLKWLDWQGQPRYRADDVVLILRPVAAGQQGGHDEAAGIAIRSVHAEHRDAVADDRNDPPHVVGREKVPADLGGDAGGTRIVERDKQGHCLRCSCCDDGNRLTIDLHTLDAALDLDVGDWGRAAVFDRGLVAGGGAFAQHTGHEIELGDGEVCGFAGHGNQEDLRIAAQVGERLLETRRAGPPVPLLDIGNEVDLLLGSFHVVDQLLETFGNAIEIEPRRHRLRLPEEVGEAFAVESHITDKDFVFAAEEDD